MKIKPTRELIRLVTLFFEPQIKFTRPSPLANQPDITYNPELNDDDFAVNWVTWKGIVIKKVLVLKKSDFSVFKKHGADIGFCSFAFNTVAIEQIIKKLSEKEIHFPELVIIQQLEGKVRVDNDRNLVFIQEDQAEEIILAQIAEDEEIPEYLSQEWLEIPYYGEPYQICDKYAESV